MRTLTRALLLLAVLCSPLRAAVAGDDELMPLLASLASHGSYGVHYSERAAFLVRRSGGELQCELWPYTGEFQRATYRGSVPEGAVAIAHTHPVSSRLASAHDRQLAAALGLPVISVSWRSLHVVAADGTAHRPRWNMNWGKLADAARVCIEPPRANPQEATRRHPRHSERRDGVKSPLSLAGRGQSEPGMK